MTTLDKLKKYINNNYEYHKLIISKEEIGECINALEKRVSKKPLFKTDDDFNNIFKINSYYYCCPSCGKFLKLYEHHCKCDQKIDWSDIDL